MPEHISVYYSRKKKNDRGTEQQGVNPIEETTVSRDDFTGILHIESAL